MFKKWAIKSGWVTRWELKRMGSCFNPARQMCLITARPFWLKYIYIYINSRTAPIKLPLIAHGHVPLIYYLLSKGIVGTSNMLILDFLDVTSLGCLCPKPAVCKCSSIKWIERSTKYSPLTTNTSILCMYVCMYVCISQHLPRFQERPSKSRLFRSLSINSEREQTNTHYTNNVWSGKL